jgi:hypothetical protein
MVVLLPHSLYLFGERLNIIKSKSNKFALIVKFFVF